MRNFYLYIFTLIVFFSSCSTSSVLVSIQQPADITIPSDIKSVVVANRSAPTKKNLAGNIIEGLVSGEGIGADKRGSQYCVEGLVSILDNSERFNTKNIGDLELKGTGTSSFPPALKWKKVKKLCNTYNADALIVLETFDSDSRILFGKPVKRTVKKKGVKIVEMRHKAILEMKIVSGWRIYDNSKQIIIDENKFIEYKEFISFGISNDDAESKLPYRGVALKQSGDFAGFQYGKRISPIWIQARRVYYSGKENQLKQASKNVKANDWDDAIEIWKGMVNLSDKNVAAKASFNMALASEITGFLDAAIDWAKKAKALGDKKANSYISILNKRKEDQLKLNKQLNN
tara:strand:- start:51 stop:1085 length:1035 start_codon:yes stop_codon:yes gene_type:complete